MRPSYGPIMSDNPQRQKLEICVFMDSVHAMSQGRDQDQGPGTEPGTRRAKQNAVWFDIQPIWGVYFAQKCWWWFNMIHVTLSPTPQNATTPQTMCTLVVVGGTYM